MQKKCSIYFAVLTISQQWNIQTMHKTIMKIDKYKQSQQTKLNTK